MSIIREDSILYDYTFYVDSSVDLPASVREEWGLKQFDLTVRFTDEDVDYPDSSLDRKQFYADMRNGRVAKTSAINTEVFRNAFEEELKAGNDVFYLAFSSGLSTTFANGYAAAQELAEKYPDRRIRVVDSLCASAGYALMTYLVKKKAEEGASLDETADYAEDIRLRMCHWFTVDDLMFLHRGGRVSKFSAIVGSVLAIKPVLHVDNDGHLINMETARGRKKAIARLVDKYMELAEKPGEGPVFFCHGDCIEDANRLNEMLKERAGVEADLIVEVGPVIGAHSGPGTLSIFFVGKER